METMLEQQQDSPGLWLFTKSTGELLLLLFGWLLSSSDTASWTFISFRGTVAVAVFHRATAGQAPPRLVSTAAFLERKCFFFFCGEVRTRIPISPARVLKLMWWRSE